MRAIFSIILNGWLSIGPALAEGLPWLALVQLVQGLHGSLGKVGRTKAPSPSFVNSVRNVIPSTSVILSEGEEKTLLSQDGSPSRSRRTWSICAQNARYGIDALSTEPAGRPCLMKLFSFRITSLLGNLGPSTAARQTSVREQIHRSPSLRMTGFKEDLLTGFHAILKEWREVSPGLAAQQRGLPWVSRTMQPTLKELPHARAQTDTTPSELDRDLADTQGRRWCANLGLISGHSFRMAGGLTESNGGLEESRGGRGCANLGLISGHSFRMASAALSKLIRGETERACCCTC